MGCKFVNLNLDAGGKNIINDFRTLKQFITIFRVENPDIVLSFTPKNNIYGALAARMCRISCIANISGVGSQFAKSRAFKKMMVHLYKMSLKSCPTVFFQNEHDRDLFLAHQIVDPKQAKRIFGSGVDIRRFSPSSLREDGVHKFLFVGRLLRDKGILIFAEAAERIKEEFGDAVSFRAVGPFTPGNPNAITPEEVAHWQKRDIVDFVGPSDQIELEIAASDCIVLPSFYGEGVPKSLLEAAACGRASITTTMPGCRDAVEHGKTGFVCQPRSVDSLVAALKSYQRLTSAERSEMAKAASEKAAREFVDSKNIELYLNAIIDRRNAL